MDIDKTLESEIFSLFNSFNTYNTVKPVEATSSVYPIIECDKTGSVIKTVKPETVESMSFPRVYDLVRGGHMEFYSPGLDMMKYSNATVFAGSDFVITRDGAVWDKYFEPQFTKMLPADQDMLKYENGRLFVKNAVNTIRVKQGFSLCGVYSTIWAHFLVQFLPKMYLFAENIDKVEGNTTIILPYYTDPQIREIIFGYLGKIKCYDILELKPGESAQCESLLYIGKTATICDNAKYGAPSDVIIPGYISELLKQNLIKDFSYDEQEENTGGNNYKKKIYIGREISFRNFKNNEEIEEYFLKKGYVKVFPHLLTLKDKVKLFRNAQCVVGPASSGFTNVMFSRPGTKVLVFTNFHRAFDPFGGFLSEGFNLNYNLMTGIDELSHDINSSYTIPMDKVVRACSELDL